MIIETHDLGRKFLRHEALRGVGLAVPEGAALALIGANGAGKTTLMRILVNILRSTSGVANVLGKDCRRLDTDDFNRIGYVTENQKLPARLTIAQFFDYLRTIYRNWDRALEEELRERFDLPPDRKLSALSHGMRMKTMLTGVLSFRPALLILDEPLSGLDPLTRDEVVEGLLGQADETTIVISSHEMAEIDGLATHVAYMARGQMLFQSTTEQLLDRFRDVMVTFEAPPGKFEGLPTTWQSAKQSERSLRFTESGFTDEADLRRQLTTRFGPIDQIECAPMSLRDVSKSLMISSRKERAQ